MKPILVALATLAACKDPAAIGADAASDAPGDAVGDARPIDGPVDAPRPCGNGAPDLGEECDDGNLVDTDACTAACTIARCGDGAIHAGVEACDDGNLVDGDGCDPLCQPQALPLRIVAGNLSTGNFQSYDLGHGQRILAALHPDVALVQELNIGDGSDAALRAFVDVTFGTHYRYFREASRIPNAVVSRFPILEAGVLDDPRVADREFVWARLDLPNTTKDLWVFSLHLLTTGSERPFEAEVLADYIAANIPGDDYLVLGGDLNSASRTEPAIATLGAVVVVAAPYPVDQNANANTNLSRSKAYDWVLADPDLAALQVPSTLGPLTFASGFVFDSRLFSQLDLDAFAPPVLVGDSNGPSMQHMAVVRDFIVP